MTTSAELGQNAFLRALLDPELPPPNGLEASHGFPPERRFAIYRNNVCVGLVDALAERFPICLQLVGDEFFRAMAQCYVRERLPRTPMLFEYGDAFATFFRTSRGWNMPSAKPITPLTPRRCRWISCAPSHTSD
ncbi:MAG: hypothetical protein FD148_2860 [Methylocystaceae bacterium]|nr:MAG: hypothetical protein FD148_2860 [Methylocystaceae bacterium]